MTKFLLCLLLLWGCGNPAPSRSEAKAPPQDPVASAPQVKPPFALGPDATGLLLVWYDEQGKPHTAQSVSDVPEASRARVRVDSLDVPPDKRLDPAFVYVADLQKQRSGGYDVRKVARDAFERSVVKSKAKESLAASVDHDVIVYGASWCGACKQAKRFLTSKGVDFVEKDIEKEPAARSEMLEKARAQGVSTAGIPVLDVRGTMVGGFDPRTVERLLARK